MYLLFLILLWVSLQAQPNTQQKKIYTLNSKNDSLLYEINKKINYIHKLDSLLRAEKKLADEI